MDPSLWLALLGAQTLISFVPGAGAVNTMSNALAVGFRRTVWGVLGQQAALLVHIAIAAAGVGILVSNSPLAFDLIRYAGAAYLVYLGIRKFLQRPEHSDIRTLQTDESALSMVRRGIWVNLLNPKAIVFFLALIPQFISPDRPLLAQYGVLTATVIGIDFLVMWFFYGGTARSFRRFTQHDRGQVILNRIFGSLFVGVGALLALA